MCDISLQVAKLEEVYGLKKYVAQITYLNLSDNPLCDDKSYRCDMCSCLGHGQLIGSVLLFHIFGWWWQFAPSPQGWMVVGRACYLAISFPRILSKRSILFTAHCPWFTQADSPA